jgi:hypothetical protein
MEEFKMLVLGGPPSLLFRPKYIPPDRMLQEININVKIYTIRSKIMLEVFPISEFVGGDSERKHGLSVLVGPKPGDGIGAPDATAIILSKTWNDPIAKEDKVAINEELIANPDFHRALGEDLRGEGGMEFHVSASPSHAQVIMAIEFAKVVQSTLGLPELRVSSHVGLSDKISLVNQQYLVVSDEAA